MNAISETLEYASGLSKIWDRQTPSQLIFFVTNRCNGHCPHCFYWRELNHKSDQELSVAEIQKISRSIGRLFWLFISGGEPFLRADLPEICRIFYENNRPRSIVIPTNGLLVEKIIQSVGKIATDCPTAKIVVQISIDEIGPLHDRMRAVSGNFAKIQQLIPKLKRLKQSHSNLAIQANIVFSRENQDRVEVVYKEIKKRFGLDNICVSLIRGEPKKPLTLNVDLDKYRAVHQTMKAERRFGQYNRLLSWLITKKEDMQVEVFLKSGREKKAVLKCLAGRQTAVLYPNGDLALCESRPDKFGNLREAEYDFNRLWQSKRAEELRGKVKNCYCTNECIYTPNVFLGPTAWPTFLKYLISGKI
jgi:MoaA/NifB/PqqE/SkfB family radical SAM enzyme